MSEGDFILWQNQDQVILTEVLGPVDTVRGFLTKSHYVRSVVIPASWPDQGTPWSHPTTQMSRAELEHINSFGVRKFRLRFDMQDALKLVAQAFPTDKERRP